MTALPAQAADYPNRTEGDFVIKDFTFRSGETLDALRIHYTTIGDPEGEPVLALHGTGGSGQSLLTDGFAGALFGPGQPLDAGRCYIILPDAIGTGGSSKPSDGLRARFPRYAYDDMVEAQHRLVTEGLGIDHLRLIIGNSMGGMHVWSWGIAHPDFADALIAMASLPAPMSGRNWMLRRMLIDSVRNDPAWMNGEYEEQPPALRMASAWFSLATSGGEQGLQAKGPTRTQADAFLEEKLAGHSVGDANDVMYQWDASRDFDPSADLEKITAPLLAINSADDERNPPELGVLERAMPRIKNGLAYLIPGGPETRGHATTGEQASLYARRIGDFLNTIPRKAG